MVFEKHTSITALCVNKIDEQYGRSISVDRLLQEPGGSSDVGKSDWLSVLSLTADWSIDCGSGLSLRGPGGAAVSWVWRRSELPNLKHSSGPQQLEEDVDDESVTFNIANFAIGLVKMVVAVLSVTTLVSPSFPG